MHRNPAHLLSLDREPAARLLRACGIDERLLRGGSDYDRFTAFAGAMLLCQGHDLATDLQKTLQKETALQVPLCPHTAPAFWKRWVEKHWCDEISVIETLDSTPCALCTPVAPKTLTDSEVTFVSCLPDVGETFKDLVAFSNRLQAALPTDGYAAIRLPVDYVFRRPDPYHAMEALRELSAGTDGDRDLLITQALRVIGGAAFARGVTVLLVGGTAEAVLPLLAYLTECGRLPCAVWMPEDPAHAAPVSGLYPTVGTGYVLSADLSPEAEQSVSAAYAAVAPIGCATVLRFS